MILLLFPKYIAVLEGVTVADFYSRPGTRKNRFIDICLIDAGGSIDVIEIKKPFNDVLLSRGLYRGNNVPTKELSGTIMQAEKISSTFRNGASKVSGSSPRNMPTCSRTACRSG
nr:Shedu anti-phage system protein SduA domain-containing protein [Bradyrhizobium murdochi]